MGQAELDKNNFLLNIYADIFFYGNAANEVLADQIAKDIAATRRKSNHDEDNGKIFRQ